MDIFRPINRHIIYPLYFLRNGDRRLARLQEIERNQFLTAHELDALRLKRLQNIVSYAYENTDYYRRVMDQRDVKPSDIKSLSDIQLLPVLTKKDLQEHGDSLLSKDFDKSSLIKDASGGSTGEPTIFYKDLERHRLRRADQYRHDRWSGWDIGKKMALVWGASRDLHAQPTLKEKVISKFVDRVYELDAFQMDSTTMASFIEQLQSIKPSMILGYANALFHLAEYILSCGEKFNFNLDGIVSSAETLTPDKRNTIEEAFGCKVLNRYGSREVGLIASECKEQSGLHINADNVYVEVCDRDGKARDVGQSGEIVVTDFWNFGMPLIRYKLGDVGTMSAKQCACGRSLPLLQSVEGRTSDFFTSTDGKSVHGEYFTHLFYGLPSVKTFQLIQKSLAKIELRVVSSDGGDSNLLERDLSHVIPKIKEILGSEVDITTIVVDSIPPTASGKFRFTISELA